MLTTRLLRKYLAWRASANQPKASAYLKAKVRPLGEALAQDDEDYFEPLSFDQAQVVIQGLRKTSSLLSPWRLIKWQLIVGLIAAAVAFLGWRDESLALSVAYGSVAVIVPASLFAWGLMQRQGEKFPWLASMRFFIWEAIKVGLTVAMLFAAPVLIAQLNWLALLAGFVVTMKVYWVAIWFYPVRKNSV